MAIPDYQNIMLPLLKFLADKKEHSVREAIDFLSIQFKLDEKEKKELLPSGQQSIFDNRVGWARTYLKNASFLESTKRGFVNITNRGLETLNKNLEKIDVKFLRQYPEFIEFTAIRKDTDEENDRVYKPGETP